MTATTFSPPGDDDSPRGLADYTPVSPREVKIDPDPANVWIHSVWPDASTPKVMALHVAMGDRVELVELAPGDGDEFRAWSSSTEIVTECEAVQAAISWFKDGGRA